MFLKLPLFVECLQTVWVVWTQVFTIVVSDLKSLCYGFPFSVIGTPNLILPISSAASAAMLRRKETGRLLRRAPTFDPSASVLFLHVLCVCRCPSVLGIAI